MKALLLPFLAACAAAAPIPLFDGKTLDGWEVPPAEAKWWRVQDGAITGGSLDEKVPKNTFLASTRRFGNFDLRFKIRLVKGDGFMNSGMQVRSRRDGSAMSGYQVDAGTGYWGDLYDEHRRNKKIAGALDPAALQKVVRDWDWNDYRILCEGPRIRSWINGVAALDYVEKDPAIALDGLLGIQTHGGGKLLVQVKDITVEELAAPAEDRSPEAEKASFQLPTGFEAELVASEREGVGKPVTVAWDASGRMWTMTALEYPVDANENAATAEALFQRGGKDRVLVFDHPSRPGPQTPRVFADRLAIPLGILPLRGGVLVQQGHDIRYYEDRNRDGSADDHRVVLRGFGIQDSHLFPHQFERSPGGWFLLAQGLYNYSNVVRPDGSPFANGASEVAFKQCKLARARLDGSAFELLTAGPNNIWGFASARDGTEFLQEANDMGIPVAEFIAGTHYRTGSKEKLRPYAPEIPPTTPGQPLGGSGLSGIALAEDAGCPFAAHAPDAKTFFIANPITNRIQIVSVDAAGNYRKRDDFLVSTDPWFRPVALHFGPDGCLYLVDWYNKIISHNEVPRMHPDRDKTRGRIWRIKPTGHVPEPMPDLTKLPVRELLGHLGGRRARVAALAWQELGDRKDPAATPLLEELAAARTLPPARRLGALWALQEMAALSPVLLADLARDGDPHIRREAIDAAGDIALAEAAFLAIVPPGERDFQVRCALANALRRHPAATPAMAAAIAPLAEGPATGDDRAAYERNFLRYLVRWALETHPAATASMLDASTALTAEARVLASLALPADQAAPALLALLPALDRPLDPQELALLGAHLSQPAVASAFGRLLDDPARREALLRALLQLDPAAATDPALRATVGRATGAMLEAKPATLPLALDLARRFRLDDLAPAIVREARAATTPAALAPLLRALNELRAADPELAAAHLDHPDPAVAREALVGFAASGGTAAVDRLAERWPRLPGAMRQFAVDGMLSAKPSAEAFARAIAAGSFAGFDPSAIEKLGALLGKDHPAFRGLLEKVAGLVAPVLRLPGTPDAVAATGIDFEGPFTVQAWIRLDPGIDNRDAFLGERGKGACINFHQARPRFYAGRDHAIADRPVAADTWTHLAVTRDEAGRIALYLDGEPAGASTEPCTRPLKQLDLGRSIAPGGTGVRFLAFRHEARAHSAAEIRDGFRIRPADDDARSLPLQGGATIEWTSDFPDLLTAEAARALAAKFDRFRALAARPGDPAAGRQLFQATCLICHQARGEGIAIGPDLSGAGAMGTESLLRNILTPNAQLESGYYRHDLALRDGGFASGFLASQNADTLVLRQIGADERAIPRSAILEHSISKRSLMPEGLLDTFTDTQVADLFAYLGTLK